jgi:hypothetical protein
MLSAVLAQAVPGTAVVSLRTEPSADGRTAVVVLLAGEETSVVVRREGARVLVEAPRGAPVPVALPRPLPPVVALSTEAGRDGAGRVVMEIQAPFEYEIRREGRELRLLIAALPGADDVETLAQMLFPTDVVRLGPPAQLEPPSSEPRLRLRPSVSALYATGTNAYEEGPQPQEDSYYDVAPRIEAFSGPLRLAYEAHLRGASRYDGVNSTTTHQVEARLERLLASDWHVGTLYEFLRGRQQTNAVDSGGEYFYGFEPFKKHTAGAKARVPLGGATHLVMSGTWDQVRFDEPGGFIDFSAWSAQGGVRREIGGQTSLELLYTRDEVYDANDPDVAGTFSDTASLSLTGEVRPMLHVFVLAGLTRRSSPGAPEGARTQTEPLARIDVRREFSPRTALQVGYQRSRTASAFERNPSYRSDFVEARGYAPLPFEISLATSAGYRRNDYPLAASATSVPRRDRIYGWALGLGHAFGSRAMLHVEYRWQRRESNLPGYSSVSDGLLVQLDVLAGREGARQ